MLKLIFFVNLIICLQITATGQSVKKLIKNAESYETQKLYLEAVNNYRQVLHKNPSLIKKYHEALRRNAQYIIDEKLSLFFIELNSDKIQKALKTFEEAEYFAREIKYFNIDLQISDSYKKDYKVARDRMLLSLYEQGKQLMDKGEFKNAKEKFQLIFEHDPDYGNVSSLLETSNIEPKYRMAVEVFEQNNYSKAWDLFEKVALINPDYQSTSEYRKTIIAKLGITLAVLPTQSNNQLLENNLNLKLIASLSQLNSPFLQIVDRENITLIIDEQKLGLSGLIDEKTAAELGKLYGAQYILVTKLINYEWIPGELISQQMTAYEGKQVSVKNNETGYTALETQYFPVKYKEFRHENILRCSFQYQLIAAETGIVVNSDIMEQETQNTINYARYDQDYLSLYPMFGNHIYKSGVERDAFIQLFTASPTAATRGELEFQAQQEIAEKITSSLHNYLITRR